MNIEHERATALAKLDWLESLAMKDIASDDPDSIFEAVEAALEIIQERNRLLGIYAPNKEEIQNDTASSN